MKTLARLILAVAVNFVGLLSAVYFVSGFKVAGGFRELTILALILTGLNLLIKPVLKLILSPIIILTLGLGLIIVNMAVLYVLDILSSALTIETIAALFYSSLIIGFVNFIFHLATKKS